jgi:uncharacterized protein YcfJ
MIMKTIIAVLAILSITGCASTPNQLHYDPSLIVASTETRENPQYKKDFNDCDWYATSNQHNVKSSALGGAVIGAGVASLFGLILGLDGGENYARLAGAGALGGGLSGAGGAMTSNEARYKNIMIDCLRKRGHEVY